MVIILILTFQDHPRFRGEHYMSERQNHDMRGSSPLSRGTLAVIVFGGIALRIIPAFAGNTTFGESKVVNFEDHPRFRGEHFVTLFSSVRYLGSSPLSRGTRRLFFAFQIERRIIPAFAGNTLKYSIAL